MSQSGARHWRFQVQYSLLYRKPETNGVMEACKEAGVTLVAYSPLCQGLLTGEQTAAAARRRRSLHLAGPAAGAAAATRALRNFP